MNRARKGERRPQETRKRILEAAGQLFARRGFHGAGFREIAAKAHVSLQMPNHHFGSKEELFAECVRYVFVERMDLPALFAEPLPRNTKKALGEKVRACFFAVVPSSGRASWRGDLVGRALTECLEASLEAIQDGLRPAREWFHAALAVIRPRMTSSEFALWYTSLWAQVSFYVTARPAILVRLGKKRYDAAFLKAAADHLVRVMLKQLENGRD